MAPMGMGGPMKGKDGKPSPTDSVSGMTMSKGPGGKMIKGGGKTMGDLGGKDGGKMKGSGIVMKGKDGQVVV